MDFAVKRSFSTQFSALSSIQSSVYIFSVIASTVDRTEFFFFFLMVLWFEPQDLEHAKKALYHRGVFSALKLIHFEKVKIFSFRLAC